MHRIFQNPNKDAEVQTLTRDHQWPRIEATLTKHIQTITWIAEFLKHFKIQNNEQMLFDKKKHSCLTKKR